MSALDEMLLRLREAPMHAGVDRLEAPVMAGLAARIEARVARRGLVLASFVAILVGSVATLIPGGHAAAEPLLGLPADAPSHLLAN